MRIMNEEPIFTLEQWKRLPMKFKRKWWKATDYGAHNARDEGTLLKEALQLLQAEKTERTVSRERIESGELND